MRSALLLCFAFLFVLASAAPKTRKTVHRVSVQPHKLSPNTPHFKHHMTRLMSSLKKSLPHHMFAHMKQLAAESGGQHSTLNLVDLIGEIQLGTPPQRFNASFLDWEEDVYVIAPNADGPDSIAEKARYDQTASTSAVVADPPLNFTSLWRQTSGHIVNDVIALAEGVHGAVDVGVADQVGSWSAVSWSDADAVFGLLVPTSNSYFPKSNVSALAQLADQLDQPIVSTFIQSDDSDSAGFVSHGQITIGALDTQNCEADYVTVAKTSEWNTANLSSVSIGDYSANAEDGFVLVAHWFSNIYVSAELFDAIVLATGADSTVSADSDTTSEEYYSWTDPTYTVDCATVASLPDLTLNLGEATLTVTSAEYIRTEEDGTCSLAVEAAYFSGDGVYLGQNFLNRHCLSNDFVNNRLGFGKVRVATTAA